MLTLNGVQPLCQYTDLPVRHVPSGALVWKGLITFGCLYFLVPRLWNRKQLWSLKLVNWHFWLAMIGIVFYAASMWVTGIMEGLLWREVDQNGFLINSFADTVAAKFPMYLVRTLGGLIYLLGAVLLCYNLWQASVSGEERDTRDAPPVPAGAAGVAS